MSAIATFDESTEEFQNAYRDTGIIILNVRHARRREASASELECRGNAAANGTLRGRTAQAGRTARTALRGLLQTETSPHVGRWHPAKILLALGFVAYLLRPSKVDWALIGGTITTLALTHFHF